MTIIQEEETPTIFDNEKQKIQSYRYHLF